MLAKPRKPPLSALEPRFGASTSTEDSEKAKEAASLREVSAVSGRLEESAVKGRESESSESAVAGRSGEGAGALAGKASLRTGERAALGSKGVGAHAAQGGTSSCCFSMRSPKAPHDFASPALAGALAGRPSSRASARGVWSPRGVHVGVPRGGKSISAKD